jgi:hypothetical protein
LPAENQITLLLPTVFGTIEYENMSSVASRNDFIMQNYYLKKRETIFAAGIKIRRKQ